MTSNRFFSPKLLPISSLQPGTSLNVKDFFSSRSSTSFCSIKGDWSASSSCSRCFGRDELAMLRLRGRANNGEGRESSVWRYGLIGVEELLGDSIFTPVAASVDSLTLEAAFVKLDGSKAVAKESGRARLAGVTEGRVKAKAEAEIGPVLVLAGDPSEIGMGAGAISASHELKSRVRVHEENEGEQKDWTIKVEVCLSGSRNVRTM
jgi:hypothetical protein